MKGGPGTVYVTKKDSVFFLTIKLLSQSPATKLFGDVSLVFTTSDCDSQTGHKAVMSL